MAGGGADILTTPPPDDAGGETLARYRYQADLVARRCVRMLVDDEIVEVICEWHEDYIVRFASRPCEIVSVKHVEPGQPVWTLRALWAEGGVGHLFARWQRLGGDCTCRLETNHGLRPGEWEPAGLAHACSKGDSATLMAWAEKLVGIVGEDDADAVAQFLAVLSFDVTLPDRRSIEAFNIESVIRPTLDEAGIRHDEPAVAYRSIREAVENAMVSSDPQLVMDSLANPDALSFNATMARVLAVKTLKRSDVLLAITGDGPRGRLLLAEPGAPTPGRTRLVKKLERGGFGPTAVRSAVRLRANWLRHSNRWSTGLPGSASGIEDLSARVLVFAGDAEGEVRAPGSDAPHGVSMRNALVRRLEESGLAEDATPPVSYELLMGLVYERTEACEIFWSEEFDPDQVP